MEIFELSRKWPADERFSLTDQIRRSSRSVCTNIAEAWRKRRYEAAFISKLSDSDSEAAETEVHLDFALRCGYLSPEMHVRLRDQYDHMCRQLTNMMADAPSWCGTDCELHEVPAEYIVETSEHAPDAPRSRRSTLPTLHAPDAPRSRRSTLLTLHAPDAPRPPHAPCSKRIIDFSLRNKFIVLLGTIALVLGGVYAVKNIPLDAIPDLSDVQVIIYTEWPGQAPQIVQDQVTYPHHDQDAFRAQGQGRARLFVLRLLVRLCHLRGRHRSLLGAQPRARIPQRPRPAVCRRA